MWLKPAAQRIAVALWSGRWRASHRFGGLNVGAFGGGDALILHYNIRHHHPQHQRHAIAIILPGPPPLPGKPFFFFYSTVLMACASRLVAAVAKGGVAVVASMARALTAGLGIAAWAAPRLPLALVVSLAPRSFGCLCC